MKNVLKKIGLSGGEIKVYSILLESGTLPVSEIHEKSGMERRNIYDILTKLIGRGLVAYMVENKKKYFSISHPENILKYLDERESDVRRMKSEIKPFLPGMEKKFGLRKPGINAEIYRGTEGIKAVWEDTLNAKTTYWIGSGRYIPKAFPNFFTSWNRRRVRAGVEWLNICRHEIRKGFKPLELEKARFLPKAFSGNPTIICVYGNKTVNFILGKEWFAFVIESEELAENYKRYHRYLWNRVAKP